MTIESLAEALSPVIAVLADASLSSETGELLNARFPAGGDLVERVRVECLAGLEAGWLCARGEPPLRYGRALKPGTACGPYSVDVVDMTDTVGPYHAHPNGEIDLVIPIDDTARFDGAGAGWIVYPPGTAHHPTVTGGRSLVLYLLPDGVIDFAAVEPR